MATRMWAASYAGAARGPGELRLRASGRDASPARGMLTAVDEAGRMLQVEPVAGTGAEWALAVGAGPILTFATPTGPMTVGPTRAPAHGRPAEFHLALVAVAAAPGEPVVVSLLRDRKPLTAVGPHDTGGVVADTVVEAPGTSMDLYLEA